MWGAGSGVQGQLRVQGLRFRVTIGAAAPVSFPVLMSQRRTT